MPTVYDEKLLSGLRGSLKPSASSSRDLATTVQTTCVRRRALAIVGASADDAAKKLGAPVRFGQSPFALQIGDKFEKFLRADHAQRLLQAIHARCQLPLSRVVVEDLDEELPWGTKKAPGAAPRHVIAERRRIRTDEILVAAVTGTGDVPTVVLHPRLEFRVTDSVRDVEPDAMVIWPEPRRLRLAEIKSYVDHRHRTDLADLATTRHQLAIYFVAMTQALERLVAAGRIPDLGAAMPTLRGPWPGETGVRAADVRALCVLRRPHSMDGSVRVEDILRDIELVKRGLARTPAKLAEILSALPPNARLDDPATLAAIDCSYDPAWCLGHCPMAIGCRQSAHTKGEPDYFGGGAREALAAAGDLGRAHRLARGKAQPSGPEQAAFAERVKPLRRRIDDARRAR